MPDYQLSKVYQIVCLTTGQKYVGSTTQKTLAERLSGHNRSFKCWKGGKDKFTTSFTILEQGNYQIELLEAFPCNSKDELNSREGHYIRTIDCVNKKIEGRTMKEWREANKTDIVEYQKEYHKSYYEVNKSKIAETVKAYYKGHKLEKAEYDKAYKETNKAKIAEQRKAKYLKKKAELQ
jgi:hypothetical protein